MFPDVCSNTPPSVCLLPRLNIQTHEVVLTVCGAILPLLVSLYNLPPICFKDMVILCSVEQLKKPKHMTIALRTAKMKRKLQSLRLLVASRSEIRFRVECLRGEKSGGTGGGGGSPLQGKKTRDKEVDALVQGLSREAAASSVRSFRGNITKKFTRGFASPDGGGKKGKKGKKGEKGKKEDGEKKGGGEDDGKDGKPNAFMAFFGQKEESKKDKKKNEKALELLVENLEMLQQLGCEFLSSVAKMSSLKYVVFRSRGVETILDAMRKFPKAHDVIWWGANALFFLCRDGAALQDDNILQLREEGADAVLATVVENYANDVTMVPHVQVLLRMLRTLDKLVVGEGHARIGGKVRFVGNEVLDEGAGAGQGGGGRQVFQRESEKPSYGGYR